MGRCGKRDGNCILIIDEKAIHSTHKPDGKKHDVRPLHNLIKEILMPSTTTSGKAKKEKIGSPTQMGGQGQVDGDHLANSLVKRYKELKEDFFGPDSQPKPVFRNVAERCFKELTDIVPQISIKLWKKCSGGGGGDANKTTMAVFKMLSSYSWEVKVVVTLAAFALIYMDATPMAKNTEPIRYLINAMVELTNTILDVDDSQPENISTHIQTAVSWTVRSIVACTSGIRYIEDELSKLTEKVVEMNSLRRPLDTLRQKDRRTEDYLQTSTEKDDENDKIHKKSRKRKRDSDTWQKDPRGGDSPQTSTEKDERNINVLTGFQKQRNLDCQRHKNDKIHEKSQKRKKGWSV